MRPDRDFDIRERLRIKTDRKQMLLGMAIFALWIPCWFLRALALYLGWRLWVVPLGAGEMTYAGAVGVGALALLLRSSIPGRTELMPVMEPEATKEYRAIYPLIVHVLVSVWVISLALVFWQGDFR